MKKLEKMSAKERRDTLAQVGDDLQAVINFKPPIRTKGKSEKYILNKLKSAGLNIIPDEDEEDLAEETVHYMKELGFWPNGEQVAEKAEEAGEEPDEEEAEEEQEEQEEEPAQNKQKAKKEKPAKAKKKPAKAKAKKEKSAKSKPKVDRVTRLTVMRDILHGARKKPLTEEQMVTQMHKQYGGNEKTSRFEVSLFLRFIKELGLVEETKDKYKYLG